MRQNKDNDIVRLSMAIREDELIDPANYNNGEVRFLHAQESPEKTFYTFKSFFKYADVIVDGRFVDELKDLSLRFRGSSNQRIWRKNENNEWKIEE